MVKTLTGDIFESKAQALVNPVNCVGVMGAGLAKQFKEKFPEYFQSYAEFCKRGELKPSSVQAYVKLNRVIFSFATKGHWKDKSKIEDIIRGARTLAHGCDRMNIASIAIPKLGCGLGGLDWADVKPVIEEAFKDSKTEVELYV